MKTGGGKTNRSRFYHLLNTIAPINHALKAKSDTWGSILAVGLLIGLVLLVKLALSLPK